MTIRTYFDNHPNFVYGGGIEPIAGVDDALLYCGVPIDSTIFAMAKGGRFDEEIPDESMRRLRELGGVCG